MNNLKKALIRVYSLIKEPLLLTLIFMCILGAVVNVFIINFKLVIIFYFMTLLFAKLLLKQEGLNVAISCRAVFDTSTLKKLRSYLTKDELKKNVNKKEKIN